MPPEGLTSKKIGLALGGGGARGLAHIGVLKVLEREGIPISCVAGTSMGSLLAALFAQGVPAGAIEAEAVRIGKLKELFKLVDVGVSKGAMLKGERLSKYMAVWLGVKQTFAELRLPLAVVAVDVLSGCEVILKDGRVLDAIRASIAMPGVFAPQKLGPYTLVDGGMLNNVPVDAARDLGAEVVIAVDVMPHFSENRPGQPPVVLPLKPPKAPRAYQYFGHIEMIMVSAMTEHRLRETKPEVVIRPQLPTDMDVLIGFDRPVEAIAAGELATEAALAQIREFVTL
jgi:NTE family protein